MKMYSFIINTERGIMTLDMKSESKSRNGASYNQRWLVPYLLPFSRNEL